jgi:predicted nucleic acid-binding protein
MRLQSLMGEQPLLIGDLVLCEVLQGARTDAQACELEKALRNFDLATKLSPSLTVAVANNYRLLRSAGITVRKTIDLIIGTFCIAHQHTLLHDDRDFDAMEKHLGLKTVSAEWTARDCTS